MFFISALGYTCLLASIHNGGVAILHGYMISIFIHDGGWFICIIITGCLAVGGIPYLSLPYYVCNMYYHCTCS